jgi:hypothetical protein
MNYHCGRPLHYTNPETEKFVQWLIDWKGQYVTIWDAGGRGWRVQRHYIALHGINERELSKLGFDEVARIEFDEVT